MNCTLQKNEESRKKFASLIIRDCGVMKYHDALKLQKELVEQRQSDTICNTVIMLEHPPVITLGAHKSENRLLVDKETLTEKNIELVEIGRGGAATAHNPGQVVIYPIIKLQSLGLGVTDYIRQLEHIGIELLKRFGINAARRKGFPGLWLQEKKIGAIGVKVKRWVTFHGMAINIKNDLSIFENIVPCGLEGVRITSILNETGNVCSMQHVKKELAEICIEQWSNQDLAEYEEYR